MDVKTQAKRLRPTEVPRFVSAILWLALAASAALALSIVWPKPYVFHVSQLTFDAWKVENGEYVLLEHYDNGYARLAGFKRYRFIAMALAGMLGGCSVHAIASLITARDMSFLSSFLAFTCALLALLIADNMLPPIVDPVYGEGGLILFPWWLDTLIPTIFLAAMIGAVIFPIRFLLGTLYATRTQTKRDITIA